jgi:hypothetical protein
MLESLLIFQPGLTEEMILRTLAVIVSLLSTCLCVGWVYSKPGYDSIAGFGAALLAFIGSFFLQSSKPASLQDQKVGSGIAIQAGRDVKINEGCDSGGDIKTQ